MVRGRVEIDVANLGGDFVIVRGDGTPLYHFTVVVDDAAMEISHVIRGEDHLSNTPKHILLFRALGYPVPVFAHLPLILNADRTKMSKRKSQTAVGDYIAQGFIREALVNYLALLGWSTGHGGGGPLARRARRPGSTSTTSRRAARSSTASGSSGSTASGSAASSADDLVDRLRPFLERRGRRRPIDRMPSDDEMRALAAARPGAAADARRDRRSRRLPVRRRARRSTPRCSCPSAGTPRRR